MSPVVDVREIPDPECENCDGRGCMGCVFREWGHDCENDCPSCCEPIWVVMGQPVFGHYFHYELARPPTNPSHHALIRYRHFMWAINSTYWQPFDNDYYFPLLDGLQHAAERTYARAMGGDE